MFPINVQKKSERCDLKQYESSLKRKLYDKTFSNPVVNYFRLAIFSQT